MFERISCTDQATELIERIKNDHGPLMFHQSGGCCDGSSPMCFAYGEFKTGKSDVWLGDIQGCPFFMSLDQFEYWKHTHLTIDVVSGRGASFSLDIPYGVRFIIKSRLFSEWELKNLRPTKQGDNYDK